MSFKTLLVVVSVCLVALAIFSCADLPTTAPQFPDFRSQTRFINAVPSQVNVMLEPTSEAGLSAFATLDAQGATGYQDVAAGERRAKLAVDPDTTRFSINADAKATVVVFPRTANTDLRFRVFQERRTFDSVPDTVGQVRLINAALGSGTFDVVDLSDTSVVVANVAFRAGSAYASVPAGNYTFGIVEHDATTVLASAPALAVANGQRHTLVVFGEATTVSVKNFQDD
jgi:hypothetical protein